MNEIKGYTPGPWGVDRPYIRGAGRVIASLESGRNEVEDAVNAHLIAAAPELFEACTLAMDVMNNEDATGLDLYECRLILTRACAKAMGVPALEFVEQELAFVARERAKMGGESA